MLYLRHGISQAKFYAWRKKFGGMQPSEGRRLTHLEAENAKLKKIVADQMLDLTAMKELIAKSSEAHGEAQCCGLSSEHNGPVRAPGLPHCRARPVNRKRRLRRIRKALASPPPFRTEKERVQLLRRRTSTATPKIVWTAISDFKAKAPADRQAIIESASAALGMSGQAKKIYQRWRRVAGFRAA